MNTTLYTLRYHFPMQKEEKTESSTSSLSTLPSNSSTSSIALLRFELSRSAYISFWLFYRI